MKKAFGDYRRLTGSSRARGSLWEGPDHLLYIESQGFLLAFTESYRRIDYSKIEAFTYGRSRVWGWTLAWQAVLVGLCGWAIGAWALHLKDRFQDNTLQILAGFSWPVMVVVLPAFIINLVKGPTCVCRLQTAVQALRLKPVTRIKQARKIAARLEVLCQPHQGGTEAFAEMAAVSPAPVATAFLPAKLPFTGSAWLTWGFVLLLISGGLTAGEMFVNNYPYFITDISLATVAGMVLVVAFIREFRTDMPPVLRGTLWASAVNYAISMVVGFGLFLFGTTVITRDLVMTHKRPQIGRDISPEVLQWLSKASFDQLDWAAWLVVAVGGISVFLALLGLPSVLHRGSRSFAFTAAAPPPPSMPVTVSHSNDLPPPPEA